jgi:branched-subunit amino acid ABC-type transport system permease component
MSSIMPFLIVGIVTGSLYGLAGVGLVLTYRTSGVFNFGHGAIAAGAAYIFYSLHVDHGLAWPLAAFISVILFGLLAGLVIEQVTRRLVDAPDAVVVVATVGLLLAINGFLRLVYGGQQRGFPQFLQTKSIEISGVHVTYAQIISVIVACVVVAALYFFLKVSRLGVAMRAVVDNPSLLSLAGTRTLRVRTASWVIGCAFASLSGILLAPTLGLDSFLLTLLVVQAFGACAIGAFKSLPLTYAGGLLVGVLASLATKVFDKAPLSGVPASMPFLVLIAVLLIMPVRKLPTSRRAIRGVMAGRSRTNPKAAVPFLVALGGVALFLPNLVGAKLPVWTGAVIMIIMFASLGLLVWTSGQISLCHSAFAAVGATTLSHLTVGSHLPWGVALILAGLSAVPLGALVAIPAIRLSGVYLALVTFGFAILMQNVVYSSGFMFGTLPRRDAHRPVLGFINATSNKGLYYVVLAVAVATCVALVVLTRSRLGRLLRAMSETPTMLSTHGLSVNSTRLLVFCISAFFAGIAGALTVTQASSVSPATFIPLQSLLWLAALAACGTRVLASPVVAAVLFAVAPAYVEGFNADQQTFAFGVLAVLAAVLVANWRRMMVSAQTYASRSQARRQVSPVRDRERTATVPALHAGAAQS